MRSHFAWHAVVMPTESCKCYISKSLQIDAFSDLGALISMSLLLSNQLSCMLVCLVLQLIVIVTFQNRMYFMWL